MARVELKVTELITISNLIEDVAQRVKKLSTEGLYIDFLYMPASECKKLADILQHISSKTYGFNDMDKELCKKLRNASN